MSGRVHDLITAESFAKWAEEREAVACLFKMDDCIDQYTGNCAIAQWLQSLGFASPSVNGASYGLDGPNTRRQIESPQWLKDVALAFDLGERSGPALAKIARENA